MISVVIAALSAQAQVITGTSQITLSTAGESDKIVRFIISSSFSDGFDNTWDAEAANPGGIYVYNGGSRYTTWASNGYTEGLAIGFGSVANNDYTLHFSAFSGDSYTIYDMVTMEAIVVNGSTPDYNFSIEDSEKSQNINDRFLINLDVATGNLETCFTGTELQITNNPFFGKVVITNNSTSAVHEYAYSATDIIDMSDAGEFPDGDYTVQVGSGANIRKFIVTVKH